jgi:NSS family neurotransmitter:Na+ symporter
LVRIRQAALKDSRRVASRRQTRQETLIDAPQVAPMMAGGANGRTFVLALLGAGLAAAVLRFPFGRADGSAWFLAFVLVGLLVVALPVVMAEGALGQFRRRNAIDALGPGGWKSLGFLLALGAVALAALLAVLAGWSARYVVLSFSESWYDDPGRHFRLLAAGPDALLATLGVLVVATAVALRGTRVGLKAVVAFASVAALVILGALALWANALDGAAAARGSLFAFDVDAVGWSLATAGILAGLMPALLGTGVTATLSAHMADRELPRHATIAGLFAGLALVAVVLFTAALATSESRAWTGGDGLDAFTQVPALFASVGGWEGGVLAGAFFGALLLLALVALVALLEAPATWINERFDSWTEGRAFVASGLVVFLVAVPLSFSADCVRHTGEALAWIAAPLLGMLLSVHVGWARPEVLDGFRVGDARHPLGQLLRPLLRYVHPPVLTLLLIAGTLGFLRSIGWADGSSGLWVLAP